MREDVKVDVDSMEQHVVDHMRKSGVPESLIAATVEAGRAGRAYVAEVRGVDEERMRRAQQRFEPLTDEVLKTIARLEESDT